MRSAVTGLCVVVLSACSARDSQLAIPVATAEPRPAQTGVAIGDLDRNVDACTDFHEFANGTWRAQNPIPPAKPRWSRRVAAHDGNRAQLQRILEDVSARKDWPTGSVEQLLGDHYASCMDETGIEARQLAPLAPLLSHIAEVRDPADLQRAIRRLHELGVAVPFGIVGDLDYHEPANFIATVVAGASGLPDRDYYLKPEPQFVDTRKEYRAHIARVLELTGLPATQSRHAADLVFALEARLAKASLGSEAALDPAATDHKMTFAQLQALAPHFDWDTYFNEADLPRVDLNVAEPKFVQQFDAALAQTPVATWKLYLTWKLADAASPWLSRAVANESFTFNEKYLHGVTEQRSRALRCVDSTEALLGEPLGRKYAERYFPPAAKAKAQEIARTLLAVLKDQVGKVEWLEPQTRQRALEKLATYNPQLGYPDRWKDYSGLVIRRDAFWANIVAARSFNVDDNRRQIGKPTDRNLWRLSPASPDAYLDLQLNEIVIPAGFLQPPTFDIAATDAVNYGAFGAGLAHDMTHSVDSLGAENDLNGRPQNWWSDADREQFAARGRCLSEQFKGYFIEPGVHHDGALVMREAIGDLTGVHLAHLALERSMATQPVPTLDGFTPEQQFFISWGQFRGDATAPEAQRQMVKSDSHPVAKFRVIGPLVNLPQFQHAFACKAGAAMVKPPERRCGVWFP